MMGKEMESHRRPAALQRRRGSGGGASRRWHESAGACFAALAQFAGLVLCAPDLMESAAELWTIVTVNAAAVSRRTLVGHMLVTAPWPP